MGFVKNIPVAGPLLAGPEKPRAPKPAPVPAPEITEPEPTLLQEDPENRVAQQRKRRASALTQQTGTTILGAANEGLGGTRSPGG